MSRPGTLDGPGARSKRPPEASPRSGSKNRGMSPPRRLASGGRNQDAIPNDGGQTRDTEPQPPGSGVTNALGTDT